MATNYEATMRRIKTARANKDLWESHLRECYRYALPERNTIDQWTPGAKKNLDVFDSTAIDSLEDYANRMETQLVPPTLNWMLLEAGTDIPEDQAEETNKYLEETTDTLFNHIRSSNFSSQIHETFLDLGISTGAIIVEDGDGIQSNLNFRAVSLSELIIERSSRGVVNTVWRDITVQAGDILKTWSRAKLPEVLTTMAQEKPEQDVTLIEGVMEVDNGYESVLIYPEGKTYLFQENLESSPWIVFRETTIPGESYGRGRVMRVLPDIKTLNLMVEDYLKALNFQANPIWLGTDDGIINPYTVRMKTNSVIPVGSNDSRNPSITQLPVSGNIQLLEFAIRGYQDVIRRALMSKPFGNIEETPVRTATEMSMRNADHAQVSIGASGRIQSELLERLVARCVYILKRAGKIADFKVDGREVKIKFTSPAARQQDEHVLANMLRYVEVMGMFPPEVVQGAVKIEDFPEEIADIMGIPARLVRTMFEKKQMQDKQAQQQQQLEQQALAMQGGAGGR